MKLDGRVIHIIQEHLRKGDLEKPERPHPYFKNPEDEIWRFDTDVILFHLSFIRDSPDRFAPAERRRAQIALRNWPKF